MAVPLPCPASVLRLAARGGKPRPENRRPLRCPQTEASHRPSASTSGHGDSPLKENQKWPETQHGSRARAAAPQEAVGGPGLSPPNQDEPGSSCSGSLGVIPRKGSGAFKHPSLSSAEVAPRGRGPRIEAACLPLGSHHPTWEREEAALCPQGPLGLEGDGLLQGNMPRPTLIGNRSVLRQKPPRLQLPLMTTSRLQAPMGSFPLFQLPTSLD